MSAKRRVMSSRQGARNVRTQNSAFCTPHSALVLFAHGARDPEWAAPMRRLQAKIAAQRPDLAVEVAFLEFSEPLLPVAIEKLARGDIRQIAIVPVFLAQGGHLKHDVPRLLREIGARFPDVNFELWPALGDVEPVLDAIGAWVVNRAPR